MPTNRVFEMEDTIQSQVNELSYFRRKTMKQQQEIMQLKTQLEQKKSIESVLKTELDNKFKTITSKQDKVIQDINDYFILPKLNNVDPKNQIVINNANSVGMLKFNLNPLGQETLDHITPEMWLSILNNDKFQDTLGQLTTAIYFHPQAPKNMTWCVTDKHADLGAIQFDFETGYLTKQSTRETIDRNVGGIIFRVSDLLHELGQKCTFNDQQNINSNKLTGMIGNPIDESLIGHIKDVAYSRRISPKSIWDFLQLSTWVKAYKPRLKDHAELIA